MKSFETWRTWVIIVGLLLFGAVASVAWPAIVDSLNLDLGGGSGRPADVVLDGVPVPAWMQGLPGMDAIADDEGHINPWLVLAVIGALIVGLIAGAGMTMGILFRLLDRLTRNVKGDSQFSEQAAALARREQERLQQQAQSQPPTPLPDHQRPRWSLVATSLVILFFVLLTGLAIADTFYTGGDVELSGGRLGNPVLPFAGGLALVALLILVVAVARRRGRPYESRENAPISWGLIWVIVSGLVFMGIGIGLTLAMRVVEAP